MIEKPCGCFVHFIEAFSGIGALAVIAVILWKRHSATFCKELDGFPIVQIIVLHCKSDNITACPAAETVKILFVRVNMAGRGLFVVKRAEANIISACSFEGDIAAHDLCDRVGSFKSFYKIYRQRQISPSLGMR